MQPYVLSYTNIRYFLVISGSSIALLCVFQLLLSVTTISHHSRKLLNSHTISASNKTSKIKSAGTVIVPTSTTTSKTIFTPPITRHLVRSKSKKNYKSKKVTVIQPPPNTACLATKTSFKANLNYTELDLLEEYFDFNDHLQPGGISLVPNAKINLTIIIPYRKRERHLSAFVLNMHSFLQLQNISYVLLVVNQVDDKKFNRGALFNVGFREASQMNYSTDCFFFHDVDLIPESGNLSYCCSKDSVIHYARATYKKNRWEQYYGKYFGGVVAATAAQFQKANGFANRFWGWGGEDDEFRYRLYVSRQNVTGIPVTEGRYLTFKHKRDKGNEDNPERRDELRRTIGRWRKDGLNSLNYTLIALLKKKYFTEIQVKL